MLIKLVLFQRLDIKYGTTTVNLFVLHNLVITINSAKCAKHQNAFLVCDVGGHLKCKNIVFGVIIENGYWIDVFQNVHIHSVPRVLYRCFNKHFTDNQLSLFMHTKR